MRPPSHSTIRPRPDAPLAQKSAPHHIPADPETSEFHLWKVLFEQTPEAVAVLSPDDRVVRINQEFTRMFGYEPDEALNRPMNDLIVPEVLVESSGAYTRLLANGARVEVETVRRRKDGSEFFVSLLAIPVTTPSGEQLVNYAIYRDITERKRAEERLRESEARFQGLADIAPVMIWMTGTDGLCNYFSKPWLDFTGRTMEQEVGTGWLQGVHPDDVQGCFDGFLPAFHAREPFRMEYRLRRSDGEYRWVIESGIPRYAAEGEFAGYIGCNIDITDRKRAEEAARRSERELREVIETIPAVAWSASQDGSNAFVNRRWTEYTGMSVERNAGSGWHASIHPDDTQRHIEKWRGCVVNGEPFEIEVRLRRADGQYRWHLVHGLPLRDERGEILKWYGIATDIDDRKRAEGLLAGEKRILEMVAKGDSLTEILDILCRFVEEQAAGAVASILLLDDNRLRHGGAPSLPKAYAESIDGAAIGPAAGSCGTAAYRREQVVVEDIATDPLWADYRNLALPHSLRACWSTPVFSSEGKVIATFAMYYRETRRPSAREQEIIEQITHLAGVAIERKLAQEALQSSQTYLAEAQRLARAGAWVWKVEGREALYLADEWYRIYGFDPQGGIPNWERRLERIHPDDRARWVDAIDRAIRDKSDYEVQFRILLPTGSVKHLNTVGHPVMNASGDLVKFVGMSTDITDRKRAEEERERLDQLEADLAHLNRISMLGELAASLSHELKQPITAAITNARTCLRWLVRDEPDLPEAREAANRAVQDANRAAEVISRLRSLYTKDTPAERELVNVNDLIHDMLALLGDEASRHGVSMQTAQATELPKVAADRVQLQQVLMNLMLNGIEAMKDAGGVLTVKSELDEKARVVISVSDTGVGLPADKENQIFEAFFTTKPQGSGMGLAISRSIVQSHGGCLWATSNAGRGATFQFTLPADAPVSSAA